MAVRWRYYLPRLFFLVLLILLLSSLPHIRLPWLWVPPRPVAPLRYPQGFQYILNTDICREDAEPIEGVLVVHSDPRKPEMRDVIRESLPQTLLRELGLRRAFMLADASQALTETETTVSQSAIDSESRRHGDIVQGNFHDSYHNLTYKHIMALDWANTFCPQARLIVKMDDDIVFDVHALVRQLHETPGTNFLGGQVFRDSVPFRKAGSKWSVSYNYWPRSSYPPYLSGWLYLVSQDVARGLVLQATIVPFFWIDDTFVTGILAEQLPITISSLRNMFVTEEECLKYTADQQFSLEEPSTSAVYAPGFVVGPSGKDLEVMRKFNQLVRYCHMFGCKTRARFKKCLNTF